MSGRARAKRICQAAVGVFVNPQGVALDLAREEIGDAFERWFPETQDPARKLLDVVLADFKSGDLDGDAQEQLTAKAIDLFMWHGLSSPELARMGRADIAGWAAEATDVVCRRGLRTQAPGLAEAPSTWNGKPLVEIDEALHGRLRGVVGQFHLKIIPATLGSDLRGSIDGFQTELLQEIAAKLDGLTRPVEASPPFTFPSRSPTSKATRPRSRRCRRRWRKARPRFRRCRGSAGSARASWRARWRGGCVAISGTGRSSSTCWARRSRAGRARR